jgi:hypothetical protein
MILLKTQIIFRFCFYICVINFKEIKPMKKLLSKLTSAAAAICISASVYAQTSGTLTCVFTEVAKPAASCYNGNAQHTLALWIQTNAGGFVKTKLRYFGGGTNDHLPTWVSNSGSNVVDATTGATASAWKTYTVTWDGKIGATTTGTLQPDGTYKVAIQSTWSHGTSATAMTTYTFTKGSTAYTRTVTADPNFGTITLNWQPAVTTGINEATANPIISVYPNPTEGVFNVDFKNATSIKVLNTLGAVIYEEKVEQLTEGTKSIDLSNFTNGIYFINVSDGTNSSNHKIILNK